MAFPASRANRLPLRRLLRRSAGSGWPFRWLREGSFLREHPRVSALLALALVLVTWSLLRDRDPWRAWANERAETRLVRLTPQILRTAEEFDFDPYLIAGVVFAESSGRPWVESSSGALGLMQLKLETAAEQAAKLGDRKPKRSDLLQPSTNLRLGTAYLAGLIERQRGDLRQALMAYNTGPTRFNRWLKEAGGFQAWLEKVELEYGPPKLGSVRHYASNVLEAAERFRTTDLLGLQPAS